MNRITARHPLLVATLLFTGAPLAAATSTQVIEELVVTARKQPESALDVPAALTVLDGATLERIGAQRLQDVELRLPNLATNQSPLTGFTARYIRGMNAGARNIGFESGYGVFVDGVYSGRYATANRVLQAVERVEFLPGPQATLFGKNTTLGVLNVVTRVPDPERSATASLDVGDQGRRSARVEAATGIGRDWVLWGSLGREKRDGFDRNLTTGNWGNDLDNWDAFAALDGTLGDVHVRLTADRFESDPALIARQRLEGFGALPPHRAENDLDGSLEDRDRGVSLRLERDLAAGTLTAITASRAFDTTMNMDDDAWNIPVQHLVNWQESQRQFSQEIRLAGDRGPLGYLAGIYYQDQDAGLERNVVSLFGTGRVHGELDTETFAWFGNLAYRIGDDLTAEAGIRWTTERKRLPLYTQDGGGVLIDVDQHGQRTATATTPSASLHYRISEFTTSHVRYARGFKSGGFNVDVVTTPVLTGLEFDDERAEVLELGVKSVAFDGRLRFNGSVFHTTYDNLQVSQYTVLPGAMLPMLRITNAASATTVGAELGLDLTLGNWALGGQVGHTRGEVDEFPEPLGPGSGDWSGNDIGGPDWTTSAWVEYGRSISGLGDLTLSVEHLYQSALGGDFSEDPLEISDSLSLTNATAAIDFGGRWTTRLRIDNLFDVERVVERRRSAAPGLLMLLGFPAEIADSTVGLYNAPRTYALELRVAI
jgi:iron complex outermembrane receptor protein